MHCKGGEVGGLFSPLCISPAPVQMTLTGELTLGRGEKRFLPGCLPTQFYLHPTSVFLACNFLFHPAVPFLPQAGLFLFHTLGILQRAAGKALQASMEVS